MSPGATHPFRVLIPRAVLLVRIGELAREIARAHRDAPPLLIAVMEGARRFAGELARVLPGTPAVGEIRAKSYGDGTVSRGDVQIGDGADLEVAGQRVLLVEDIVDTGRTVAALAGHFLARGARAVQVATLLSKPARRLVAVQLDYVGFEIEDHFVIGFGMDVAGRYRELPEIAIYDQALERAPG